MFLVLVIIYIYKGLQSGPLGVLDWPARTNMPQVVKITTAALTKSDNMMEYLKDTKKAGGGESIIYHNFTNYDDTKGITNRLPPLPI